VDIDTAEKAYHIKIPFDIIDGVMENAIELYPE
jgi:hypothetical protein